MRRLIINADDFGLTSGVNRAIAESNRHGVVTSATMMATGRAFHDAASLAATLPGLATGCHVVLIDGEPVSSTSSTLFCSPIYDPPQLESSLKTFAWKVLRKRIAPDDIEREAAAQIRMIQSWGIRLTHVDSHKHTHMFPHVLRPVLRAARACGISAVRNPFEPLRSWPGSMLLHSSGLWLRSAAVMGFHLFARQFRKILQEVGMATTDGTIGIAATGRLDQKMLVRLLNALPEGTWELVCHPGYADADLKAAGTRLIESREAELQALTSEETRQALARLKIDLISYADLGAPQAGRGHSESHKDTF